MWTMVNVVREHEDCLWERMTDVRSRVAAMVAAPLLAPLIKMLKQHSPPIGAFSAAYELCSTPHC
jgi:hypothetical protein